MKRFILGIFYLLLTLPCVLQAQKLEPKEVTVLVNKYKNDIRGPYKDIRWFCTDGSIRPPKDPCPDNIGTGVQHARYKDEVVALGKSNHIFLGQILAYTDMESLWDVENDHSRLKQYQLDKYLRSVDNGWINQKGQFYRGAIQSEDEQAWGIEFYNWLLAKDEILRNEYFLVRQSLKDIPHNGDDNVAQKMRSESKVISDLYLPFMDLRTKIHSQPEESDIQKVIKFKKTHSSKLPADIAQKIDALVTTMKEFHKPVDISALAQMAPLTKGTPLGNSISGFASSSSELNSPKLLVEQASQLLYDIREGLLEEERPMARLQLLDVSLKLEEIVFKSSPEYQPQNLKDLLHKICYLGMAVTGSGYLEQWEWNQLAPGLTNYDVPEQSLGELTEVLNRARAAVEWSAAMTKANYDAIVKQYVAFEPLAAGFIDDKIRGSVSLHLGQSVGELGNMISMESQLANKVMDVQNQSTIRGLNPGYAFGELVVVGGSSDDIEVSSDKIYVFQRPPSDLKPVAGIATVAEGNMVSHVQLLARNLGIPNAALSDENLQALKKYDGTRVFYAVSNKGNVIIKPENQMSQEELALFAIKERREERIEVPVGQIRLDENNVLNMRSVDADDSGKLCGPKAANLGQLKKMFPDKVVEGLVIPFGIFRTHMDQPMPDQEGSYWQFLTNMFQEANRMLDSGITENEVENYQLRQLEILRAAIKKMELLDSFVDQLENGFKEVLGGDLGNVPVFLRSDTNMEDLKEFTGAGLNLTIFNSVDKAKILEGIKDVWASPYTERSFKWRQKYLLNPENVYPSILVIPSVDVDYSGVLITKGISSGTDKDLTVAFSRGAGGAVDGQAAEQYLIKDSGGYTLLAPARERFYNVLPVTGGIEKKSATFQERVLKERNIKEIRDLARTIRERVPKETNSDYEGAFDVELGFKDDKLWLFQIRPFVENKKALGSTYLESITPKIDLEKRISLSKKLQMKKIVIIVFLGLMGLGFSEFVEYPIDGYERTGIKRLKRLEMIKNGELKESTPLPAGAMKSWEDIKLNLLSRKEDSVGSFFEVDESFQKDIGALFRGLDKSYSFTIMDISDPDSVRYAERNKSLGYQPGSVGKLAVLTALFEQLAKVYPDSFELRTQLLKNKMVKAGVWGLTDEHTVPIFNVEKNTLVKRQVVASDVFSLYEWADHMLSVSNNGAASIVWREALLMAAFGEKYPELTEEEAMAYFKETPKKDLTDMANDVVNLPLRDLGITADEWRLGSFFTSGANTYVGDKGGSIGTPYGLMKFLVQLEQGKVVDKESSLEMKRLMYMTDRRIRYAQSPALKEAAVYFKSGSLYKCDRSKGEECGKYMGNVQNFMNSVIIVEHPDNCRYMVVLMTNVLRKNSASDHMYLASAIDKIVRKG